MSAMNNASARTKGAFHLKIPVRKIRLGAVILIIIALAIPAAMLGPYALQNYSTEFFRNILNNE